MSIREIVKVSSLQVGDRFLDLDGDLGVLVGLQTREATYEGERVQCRFYNTLNDKGEEVCIACPIPLKATVERA